MKCVRDFTVINSQPSIEALEKLIKTFFETFGIEKSISDIFHYGVFCKVPTYINYGIEFEDNDDVYIPKIITSTIEKYENKEDFVKRVMKQVIRKEYEKPEWMKYIELNAECNEYGQAPSSFLMIEVVDEKYQPLADALIEFLYSPNLTITMVES